MVARYRVEFLPEALNDLGKLDTIVAQRILRKIRYLTDNFESVVPERLSGELKGAYKLRIG